MRSALPCFAAGCFAALLVAACTSSSTNDGSLTICRNLPSSGNCAVNLAYLSCNYSGDAGEQLTELCLSDNVNQCPDGNGLGGSCESICNAGEYGATCNESASHAPPASNCRSMSGLRTSDVVYCCPCGS